MIRDPHELGERAARFQADSRDELWLDSLNDWLAEASLASADEAVPHDPLPLIYIVGAPRSGTTLLSQLASRHLRVGYINNLIARFWRRPSVGIRLSRILLGDARNTVALRSEHGRTSDIAGPHEFGYFWRHWLRLDTEATHHLSEASADSLDADGLRAALEREILAPFGLPVVFKNVICGFQAAALTRIHPRSIFVHIVRARAATAASILQARQDRFGALDVWWSLKPSTYADIVRLSDPCEQVIRQVDDCRREIDAELGRPGVRAVRIDYESLCANPRAALELIVAGAGDAIDVLGGIPESLAPSPGPAFPAPLRDRLLAALDRPKEG